MKKTSAILLLLLIISLSFSKENKHKVSIDEDTVSVDGKPLFLITKFKGSVGSINYFVKDLQNKKLVFLQSNSYKDPKEVSSSNPTGNVVYFEVTFMESGAKAEIPLFMRQSKVAEFLVREELMPDGILTEESEKQFILVNGQPYSKKRAELGGNTIIINNNDESPRNGLNIHIHR
jgi:hypothetical protein